MKNINKKIKALIVGALIGEAIALYYKDEKFKKKLNKSKDWMEKLKTAFNEIIQLNTRFWQDVSSYDYKWEFDQLKEKYLNQLESLNEKIEELKSQIDSLTQQKLKEKLEVLKSQFEQIKQWVMENSSNIADVEALKKMISKIQRSLTSLSKK